MAEMTAAEAVRIINSAKSYLGQPDDYCSINLTVSEKEQIAAIIEQQAATIEAMKLCWNCKFIEADRCNKHNCLIDYPMRDKCDNWQLKEGQ